MFEKAIQYDRESKDFKATLDGELISYFNSYHDAEVALDQLVFDLITHGAAQPETAHA